MAAIIRLLVQQPNLSYLIYELLYQLLHKLVRYRFVIAMHIAQA